jgi:hypothetical protein
MISWIKYDRTDRNIVSHVTCLITDGENVRLAQHAKLLDGEGYGWYLNNGGYRANGVTHWSPINLPGEETTE